jgi:hypothetical protein
MIKFALTRSNQRSYATDCKAICEARRMEHMMWSERGIVAAAKGRDSKPAMKQAP